MQTDREDKPPQENKIKRHSSSETEAREIRIAALVRPNEQKPYCRPAVMAHLNVAQAEKAIAWGSLCYLYMQSGILLSHTPSLIS